MVAGAIILTFSATSFSARAQTSSTKTQTTVQETDDEVKVNIYTKFANNYKTNRGVAYEAGKDYLQRYAKDNDQYVNYIREWVALYEKEQRQRQLRDLVYSDRNFVEAFKLGKQVLAEEPDYLDALIAL